MEKIELELDRSNRNASILRSGTNTKGKCQIHVSYFVEGSQILWSVRLNDVGNRVTHLSFVSVIFLVRNLLLSLKESTRITPSVNWPGIRGMNGLTKYLAGLEGDQWKLSNQNMLSVGQTWEARVQRDLSPTPAVMENKMKTLNDQLQNKMGGSVDESIRG